MVTRGYELVQLQLQTSPLQRPHGFSSPTQERWLQLLQESLSVDFERKTRGAWRQCCTAPRPGGEVTQRSLGTCGEEVKSNKVVCMICIVPHAVCVRPMHDLIHKRNITKTELARTKEGTRKLKNTCCHPIITRPSRDLQKQQQQQQQQIQCAARGLCHSNRNSTA